MRAKPGKGITTESVRKRYKWTKADSWCLRQVYQRKLKHRISHKKFLQFLWKNGNFITKIIISLKKKHSYTRKNPRGGMLSLIIAGLVSAITSALAAAPPVIASAALVAGTELVVQKIIGN